MVWKKRLKLEIGDLGNYITYWFPSKQIFSDIKLWYCVNKKCQLSILSRENHIFTWIFTWLNHHFVAKIDIFHSMSLSWRYLRFENLWIYLSQVDDDAFYGLNKLHQLELGWNQITTISPTWLDQLPLLRTLKLSHNLINKTDSKLWKYCDFLEILDLSYNGIAHLKHGLFSDLTELLELSLSHNQLGDLESGTFWGLSALQAL